MGTHRARLTLALVAGLGVAFVAPAFGQQGDRAQPPPASPPPTTQHDRSGAETTTDVSPARLRARLASLLEELESNTTKIRSVIEILDEGGTAEEAIQAMGGPARVRRLAEFWGQWSWFSQNEGRDGRPGATQRPRNGPAERGADRGPGGDRAADISAERVSRFLEEHAPELAAKIRELRAQDPRRAEFFEKRLRPRVAEILIARQHDPELGDLLTREFRVSMELIDAGRRYARMVATQNEGLDLAREKLRTLAAAQVDLRLARRERDIRQLAARLEALQAEVDLQREDRDRYIDEIVERAGTTTDRRPELRKQGGPERRGPRDGKPGRAGDE
ncbi:MAG: hypothetical protein Q9O74_09950 [Planctomycetota bacterium]|nr:hypothetical protein [Planctomycetota bacterium]